MPNIKLVRTKVIIPDDGLKLHVVYEDQANPLKDSNGNVQLTSTLDESGNPIPEYFEFAIDIDIPEGSTPSGEIIDTLLVSALDSAKSKVSERIEKEDIKNTWSQYVMGLPTPIVDYEGDTNINS